MPDSKTTRARRRGSGIPAGGPGWGGPAKGASTSRFSAEQQPSPESKSAGWAEAKTAREAARPHAVRMVEIWRQIAENPEAADLARISAAVHLVNRAEGLPTQVSEISGSMTQRVISGEPLTPEQWSQKYEAEQSGDADQS